MPYLVRMKNGATAPMRDGTKMTDEVKRVLSYEWSRFENLPGGIPPEGNPQTDVRAYSTEEEAAKIIESTLDVMTAEKKHRGDYDAKVQAKLAAIKARNAAAAEAKADEPPPEDEPPPGPLSLADVEGTKPPAELDPPPPTDEDAPSEEEPAPEPPKAKDKPKGRGRRGK